MELPIPVSDDETVVFRPLSVIRRHSHSEDHSKSTEPHFTIIDDTEDENDSSSVSALESESSESDLSYSESDFHSLVAEEGAGHVEDSLVPVPVVDMESTSTSLPAEPFPSTMAAQPEAPTLACSHTSMSTLETKLDILIADFASLSSLALSGESQKRIQELERIVDANSRFLATERAWAAKLERDLDEAHRTSEKMREEKEQLDMRVVDMKMQISERDARLARVNEERREFEEVRRHAARLEREKRELELKVEGIGRRRSTSSPLVDQKRELEARVLEGKQLRQELEASAAKVARLTEELASKERDSQELKTKLDEAGSRNSQLAEERDALRLELDEKTVSLARLDRELSARKASAAKLSTDLDRVRGDATEQNRQLESFTAVMAQLSADLEAKTRAVELAEQRANSLANQLTRYDALDVEYRKAQLSWGKERQELSRSSERLKRREKELDSLVANRTSQVLKLQEDLAALRASSAKEKDTIEVTLRKTREEKDALQRSQAQDSTELARQLETERARSHTAQREIDELKDEVVVWKMSNGEVRAAEEKLRSRIHELEHSLAASEARVRSLESRLASTDTKTESSSTRTYHKRYSIGSWF
ncbi:hypothetical protein VNI00_006791 [Paramarasmius palmivorus]|uniref:Uncharacterized protein n=1 Tax=Paramarasmius palmivorus TaxID=297713 RepID=A0AAW0D9R1_9AGAR